MSHPRLSEAAGDHAAYVSYLQSLAQDNSAFRRRFREAFFRAMRRELTSRQFAALWAHDVEGKKGCDIAREWGVSPSAVSRHLTRGRKRLRVLLEYNLEFQQSEGIYNRAGTRYTIK